MRKGDWQLPFEYLDRQCITPFGEDVEFTPFGAAFSETVKMIRTDPLQLANGALVVLFGTIKDSGFSQPPMKNDIFTIAGTDYRAFEVLGPDAIGGYHISLSK